MKSRVSHSRRSIKSAAPIAGICAALIWVGCGSGGDSTSASPTNPSAAELTTGVNVKRVEVAGKTKPKVHVPDGPPPKKIIVKEIEAGSGPRAKVGDLIKIEYVGVTWAGNRFSDSWTYPEVPVFKLGSYRLEYGLDLGIRGMKVGGRREVIVPANRLYPPGAEHDPVRPDNAVFFIVDLVKIL